MASTQTLPRKRGPIHRVPPTGLVLGGIASVQFGAALAATLFVRVGPGGAVLLRLTSATIVLAIVSRPRIRGRTRRELLLALLFGLILAAMNLTFYQAIDRIPLGVAVTIEFVGPLTVAVISSKRRLDLIWIALAALGILALMHGDTHSLNTLGVILALIAGCLWGCYILVNSRVGQAFEGGAGLSAGDVRRDRRGAPGRDRAGRRASAGAARPADRRGGRDALLGDPVLVRAGGTEADGDERVRGADEHRAGDGGVRRFRRARSVAQHA